VLDEYARFVTEADLPEGFAVLITDYVRAAFRAHPCAVGIYSMLPERIVPCRSVFPWKYESEVVGSTLPGMDETTTLGGSVILQTHR
jgi:hypothetical protein